MQDDPNMWLRALLSARSPEVWAAIGAGILYVYRKSPQPTLLARTSEALASGLLAYSISEWVALKTGVDEAVAAAFVTVLGYVVLDVVRSIVADRQILKEIIVKRLGGK